MLEQLQNGLPASQEAYIEGDRITHSYVKKLLPHDYPTRRGYQQCYH